MKFKIEHKNLVLESLHLGKNYLVISDVVALVATGPQLSMSLVPRISPSPPKTLGNCLHLPLTSAIIMIIIVSKGLIQLARAK